MLNANSFMFKRYILSQLSFAEGPLIAMSEATACSLPILEHVGQAHLALYNELTAARGLSQI